MNFCGFISDYSNNILTTESILRAIFSAAEEKPPDPPQTNHTMEVETPTNFMSLPPEMIDKILSYLSYDQIAKMRAVNRTFNNVCSDKLNKGFIYLEQFHNKCLKAVKSKLPRRESERKHHPFARHSDILMAVETRLSMLSMTYTKYIEERHCCFIPGKVLDEALKVLYIINKSSNAPAQNAPCPSLPRPHDFLQEYRDISSMAMEHFDDKILPGIREKMKLGNPRLMYLKNRGGQTKSVRNFMLELKAGKVTATCNIERSASGCSRFSALPNNPGANNEPILHDSLVTLPVMKLLKMLRDTQEKCNNTRKAVDGLNQDLRVSSNLWKAQNNILRRKVAQQKTSMKVMKRRLKETRHTLSVMTKDLTILKLAQTSARADQAVPDRPIALPDRPVCRNLSVTMTSSLSCPVKEETSTSSETKGVKRKLDCA